MPIPEITTERLLLRPVGRADAEACFEMYSDPEVTEFLNWTVPGFSAYQELLDAAIERWKGYAEGLGVSAGIELKSGRLAGIFMLKPLEEGPEIEVGYHLARWAWGQGYATEGAAALLRHGRETVGLERIVAVVRPDNERSLRVVERLGMEPDGELDVYGTHCLQFRS